MGDPLNFKQMKKDIKEIIIFFVIILFALKLVNIVENL
jgi:hypothetical protein